MTKVTSTEANRRFSELLAKVRKGQIAEITVRGEVVAKLVPVSPLDLKREEAFRKHLDALRSRPVLNLPRATRDEMYER